MKTTFVLLRMLRVITLLAFIIALFMTYVNLPLEVAVHYDEVGSPDQFITKSQLFYGLTAFVVLFNFAFFLLSNLVPSVPVTRLQVPNRTFWIQHPQTLKEILISWLSSFASVIHAFLIVTLVVILLLNTSNNAEVHHYNWLLLLGGTILFGWFMYLPFRLRLKNASDEE